MFCFYKLSTKYTQREFWRLLISESSFLLCATPMLFLDLLVVGLQIASENFSLKQGKGLPVKTISVGTRGVHGYGIEGPEADQRAATVNMVNTVLVGLAAPTIFQPGSLPLPLVVDPLALLIILYPRR